METIERKKCTINCNFLGQSSKTKFKRVCQEKVMYHENFRGIIINMAKTTAIPQRTFSAKHNTNIHWWNNECQQKADERKQLKCPRVNLQSKT